MGTKYQGLCNDIERRRSTKSVARGTTQGRTDSGIEITICSTLLLHSKEGQFIMIGSGL